MLKRINYSLVLDLYFSILGIPPKQMIISVKLIPDRDHIFCIRTVKKSLLRWWKTEGLWGKLVRAGSREVRAGKGGQGWKWDWKLPLQS